MNIKINLAKTEDWGVIQKLNIEVYKSDSKFDPDLDMTRPLSSEGEEYYKKLASGVRGKCAIAYYDHKPIGYIAMSELKFDHRKSRYIEIENMGVSEEYRSHGVGSRLMTYARDYAKEMGINKIFVIAYYDNEKAINFYKNKGFRPIGLELEMEI